MCPMLRHVGRVACGRGFHRADWYGKNCPMPVGQRSAIASTAPAGELASPSATRVQRRRWRDPRLWLGVVLVLGCVVVGARVLAAADDTVAVWVLDADQPAGSDLAESDVHPVDVHFADPADGRRYLPATEPLPPGLHLVREVGAGELLAAAAVSTDPGSVPAQLPLGVSDPGLPADLAPGESVDVWAVPTDDRAGASALALRSVDVLSVASAGAAGPGGDRQVLVSLPRGADVATVLNRLRGSTVVLVRIGG